MSGATYEWIRMDADFECIAAIAFEQPDFMWVSQLQRDRDVVAQLEVSCLSMRCAPGLNFSRLFTLLRSNPSPPFRVSSPRQCSSPIVWGSDCLDACQHFTFFTLLKVVSDVKTSVRCSET